MIFWGLILLMVNLAFLAGIVYIVFFKRPLARAQGAPSVPIDLLARLGDELKEVRGVARRLETRSADLTRYEAGLRQTEARLDELMRKASATGGARDEDIHSRALSMLKSGVPAQEIARSLGLLKGEAELLTSLHRS